MPLRAVLRLAALAMALTACDNGSGSGSSATLTTTRDSTGGILRIRHVGEAPVWTPVEVMTIGSVDEGPDSFARIRSILLGHDGGVLVADAGSTVVREFGPDGAYRRDIGRDGAGPAEYREPYSLAWMGDTLALLDPMNARIGLFHQNGSWAGQWLAPVITGPSSIRLYPTDPGMVRSLSLTRDGDGMRRIYVGHRSSGPVDTLADLPPAGGGTGITCERPSDQALLFYDKPFSAHRLHLPGPGATHLVTEKADYRIATLTPAGDTLRILERDALPAPISDAEWHERTERWREDRAKYPDLQCTPNAMDRPATKPAVDDFFLADDGTLWVDRWTAAGRVTEVFSAAGDLLGAFPAIERNRNVVPSARGNRLAVVVNDADGIPFVRVYELR